MLGIAKVFGVKQSLKQRTESELLDQKLKIRFKKIVKDTNVHQRATLEKVGENHPRGQRL